MWTPIETFFALAFPREAARVGARVAASWRLGARRRPQLPVASTDRRPSAHSALQLTRAPSRSTARWCAAQPAGQRSSRRLGGGAAVGEGEHGRAGAGDDGGHAVGAQRVDQRERLGHRRRGGTPGAGSRGSRGAGARAGRRAPPPAAPHGRRRPRRRRAAPRSGSRPRATSVETGVGGTSTTAETRGSTERARRRRTRPASLPEIDEAAVEGGGDVVGVALESGGEVEQRVVVHQQRAAGDQRPGQADARRRSRPTTSPGRGRAG